MTPLEYIYDAFITRSFDKRMFTKTEDEDDLSFQNRISNVMKIYLQSAIDSFNSRYKYFNVEMDFETGEFKEKTDDIVREILIMRMLQAYTERRINELNALAQSVRNKDFEIHSKANELKAVRSARDMYREEVERLESNFDWLEGINRVY